MAEVNEKREKAIKAGRDLLQSSIEIISGKMAHLHLFHDIMKEEVDERINATLDSLDELEPHLAKDFPQFEIKLFHPSLFMKREVYTPLDPVEKFQSAEEVIETNDMARAITKNISDFTTQPDSPHLSASLDKHSGSGSFSPFEAVEDDRSAKTPPHEAQEMTSRDNSDKKSRKKEEITQTTSKTSKTLKKKVSKKRSKDSNTKTGKMKKIKRKIKKVLKGNKKTKEKTKKKSKESKKTTTEDDEETMEKTCDSPSKERKEKKEKKEKKEQKEKKEKKEKKGKKEKRTKKKSSPKIE